MGGQRENQVDSNYIGLPEACDLLEASETEVRELIGAGKLHAYKIGGQHIRIRRDQISEVKAKWRINRDLFSEEESPNPHVWVGPKVAFFERIRDFFYFSDFYIVSAVIIAGLIYLIVSSQ